MELRRTARGRHSTLLHSSFTALHFHPRLQLSLHRESRDFHFSQLHLRTLLSNTTQIAAARATEPRPAGSPPTSTRQSVLRVPETLLRNLTSLRFLQRHTQSFSVMERLRAIPAPPTPVSDAPVQRQVKSLFQLVHHRTHRVEDSVARISREVAVRKAAPPAPPSPRLTGQTLEPRPGAREPNQPADSVHVAPWLKTVPPAVSIEQLTEQVIRQIDSRMIACRERMGKY
jgi:hypothetical protein